MSTDERITVEVVYGLPERQLLKAIEVPTGTTAFEAAKAANLEKAFPDLVLDDGTKLGVFGQLVAGTQELQAGDRVEIYRPLIADPKEVRKARAARAAAKK